MEALSGLPGVEDVEVLYKKSQARMTLKSGSFDPTATEAALKAAGFGGGERQKPPQ